MTQKKIDRKIAVIFATDVVGYSKHMEANESETIHNLRACEAILTGLLKNMMVVCSIREVTHFLQSFQVLFQPSNTIEFQKAVKTEIHPVKQVSYLNSA